MTSKRSVKSILKKARRPSEPFAVKLGDEELTGTLTALPFMRWQELLAAHPPREGNDADEGWAFCYGTFMPALAAACISDPDMDDEDRAAFADALGPGDAGRLGMQAYMLNVRSTSQVVDVPKSSIESPTTEQPSSD